MTESSSEEKQILVTLTNNPDISPDQKESGKNLIFQITSCTDGLKWCFSIYPVTQHSEIKHFIINVFAFWLQENFEEIPSDYLEPIRQLIFAADAPNSQKLHLARALFIRNYFPNIWPEFWTYLFDQNLDFQSQFLDNFSNLLAYPTPLNLFQLKQLKNQLRSSNIPDKIYEIVFHLISNSNVVGFSIISTLVRWTDISWIHSNSSNLQSLIQKGFSSAELAPYVFKTLQSIIQHHMPNEDRFNLISTFSNPEMIANVCQTLNTNEVTIAAAKFIATSGEYLMSNPDTPPHPLCDIFIRLSGPISTILIPYLYSYSLSHPLSFSTLISMTFAALETYFSKEDLRFDDESISYPKQWTVMISSAYLLEKQLIQQHLEQYAFATDPSSDHEKTCALLSILGTVICDKVTISDIPDFIEHFQNILDIPVGTEKPVILLYEQYLFLDLLSVGIKQINKEIPEIFMTAISSYSNLLVSQTLNPCSFKLFRKQFFRFIQLFNNKILPFNGPLIQGLLLTGSSKLSQIASSLISITNSDPNLSTLVAQILTEYQATATDIPSLTRALSFMAYLKIDDPSLQPLKVQIIESFIPQIGMIISQNIKVGDSLLALWFLSCYNILRADSLNEIKNVISNVKGAKSLNQLCRVLTCIIKLKIHPDPSIKQDIVEISKGLLNLFRNIITNDRVHHWYGEKENTKLVLAFFDFLQHIISDMDQEEFNNALNLAKIIMTTRFNNFEQINSVLSFLRAAVIKNPQQILSDFLSLSFCFFEASNYNPNSRICRLLNSFVYSFHTRLVAQIPDPFIEQFHGFLSMFGLEEVDTSKYLFKLKECEDKMKIDQIRLFYQPFYLNRAALDY